MCGMAAQAVGVGNQRSRKALSNSLLISPARGPCSWWLMPPVPQICTFSVLVKALHRLADRLAQVEAALADGTGYCTTLTANGITGQGQVLAGCAAHQRQRHGQAVVHVHLVDDGQVEILLDHRLRNVRGQFGVADDGHRARAPAFVGRL